MFFVSKKKFETEMCRRLEEIREHDDTRRWNNERFNEIDKHFSDLARRVYKLEKKAGKGVFFALFLFVGIPIPGTGAWTGTLAASMLGLDYKKSVFSVLCGVLLAGAIMLLLSMGVFGAVR